MADQFVLKGVNELRDYTYTGSAEAIAVKNDPRGGSTWQIQKWWDKKGNNTQYESCTILDVLGTNYLLVIPTSMDTQLQVTYDNDVYNIIFSNFNAVDRIAVYGKDVNKLVVEYLLPSISGGAIAKRILQPPATIGAFTITGPGSSETGQSTQYKSNATPDASDAVYSWTVEQSGSAVSSDLAEITAGQAATGCTVQWKQAGNYDVKCVITSNTATDSPQSDSRAVTCTQAITVGTVAITGPTTIQAEQNGTYSASVTGNNTDNLNYNWTVNDAAANIVGTGSSVVITFEAQGNATVKCDLTSSDTADTDSDTLGVTVETARNIGGVTVSADTTTPTTGVADNFQCTFDGNVLDATYQWAVTPDDGSYVIAAATAAATDITFNTAQAYDITCTVSSATGQDSPTTSSAVTVNAAAPAP